MELRDWGTIYAAVLSTAVFAWNWRNSKPKFSIDIVHGAATIDGTMKRGVYVFIKNPSPHKVNISSVSLLYPYRDAPFFKEVERMRRSEHSRLKRYWAVLKEVKRVLNWRHGRYSYWVHTHFPFDGIDTALPRTIEPRDSHKIFIPEENLKDVFSESTTGQFAAVAHNSLWDRAYSAPFKMYYK
jgi:hypothetical protein